MSRPEPFEDFVGQFGTSSWSIFFIKAPIDAVSDAYSRLLGREIDHDVNVVLAKRHQYPPIGAVTQVANSPWTIVFHLLGESEPFRDWEPLERELSTDLLRFEAHDTSGLSGCSLAVPGQDVVCFFVAREEALRQSQREWLMEGFKRAGVSPPAAMYQESTVVESYDQVFDELGIQTVRISIKKNGSVMAAADSYDRIVRVDLLRES